MKTGILCTILFCAGTVGFVAWRVYAAKTQRTPHFAIVEDQSMSHEEGCKSLLGLAEQALRAEEATANSTLTVLMLGDQTTAYQPQLLGRFSIPRARKVLEGRAANRRRQQEILRNIENKCQVARRTKMSPVFLAVKQAVADLRAQGCGANSHCELFIDSDLEENVETSIKKSFDNQSGGALKLPAHMNNDGIAVTFCGLAVTAGRIVDPSGREPRKAFPHNSEREDQLRKIWLDLFTKPEAVRFQPYCPLRRD